MRADPPAAHALTSSGPRRLVDELEVDVLERVRDSPIDSTSAPTATSARATAGAAADASDTGGRSRPARRRSRASASTRQGQRRREGPRRRRPDRQRGECPDHERLREQPLAELVGPTDGPQRRFRIATRSHSRSASSSRWVVRKIVTPRWRSPSISSWTSRDGDRIEPRRRLVEEQHLRVAEQRPRQRDPLAQALRQRAAGVVGPVGQLDRAQARCRSGPRGSGTSYRSAKHSRFSRTREAQVQARATRA